LRHGGKNAASSSLERELLFTKLKQNKNVESLKETAVQNIIYDQYNKLSIV